MSESSITLNPGVGGAKSATYLDSGNRHHQEVVIQTQASTNNPVSVSEDNPLPIVVTGTPAVTISGTPAVTVSGLQTVAGNIASGVADSGNPVKVGGVYNSSPITVSTGQRADLQTDVNGYLKVNIAAGAAAGGTSSSVGSADPSVATAAGFSDGTNLRLARVFDADTGGGTQYIQGVQLRASGSGGSTEIGVAAAPLVIGGAAAAASAQSGNPVPIGGVYVTTPPTYTNGQMGIAQLDASGNLKVNVQVGGGTGGTSSSFAAAVPGTGTAVGFSDGTNMQLARVFDLDTGGGTIYAQGVSIRLSGSGATTEGGSTSAPLAMQGNVASGAADSANPVKVGGVYNSSAPTLTNGNRGDLQLDANGNLKVNLTVGGLAGFQDNAAFTPNTTQGLAIMAEVDDTGTTAVSENNAGALRMTAQRSLHVAARDSSGADATDTSAAAIKVVPSASINGGATPGRLISAASNNATSVKGSAGTVYYIHATNNHATNWAYLKLYNKASAPTVGSDTPVQVFGIPPATGFNVPLGPNGAKFTTGIALAIVQGIADSDNTSTAANQVNLAYGYV